MRFLCSFLLFLFYFVVPSTCCDVNNITNVYCCFKHTIKVRKPRLVNLDPYNLRKDDEVYRVFGVTRDCHVFYGWLHYMLRIPNVTGPPINMSDESCAEKKIIYMKTVYYLKYYVDAHDRRVRAISAFSGNQVTLNESLEWLKVNPSERASMLFTGPVDQGFEIVYFFNTNYKAYVLAKSQYTLRVYEMRVFIDNDRTQHAYLRKHFVDVNPLLFPPDIDYIVKDQWMDKDSTKRNYIYMQAKSTEFDENYTAFTQIPLVSMMANSFRHFFPGMYEYTNYVYREKSNRFNILPSEGCKAIVPSFVVHPHVWRGSGILNSKWVGFSISTRRNMNARNLHRRMAAPHVIRRRNSVDLRDGWEKQIGVFLGFVVGIAGVIYLMQLSTKLVQIAMKKKKGSASTSLTQ